MTEARLRVRFNRSACELDIEGTPSLVEAWWTKLSPLLNVPQKQPLVESEHYSAAHAATKQLAPVVFGEYFSRFRNDVTDVDKVLIAGSYVQMQDGDKSFSTSVANQLLLEQNVKVSNASENVRRLIHTKRVFAVSRGKYRVSSTGFEHLDSLKMA